MSAVVEASPALRVLQAALEKGRLGHGVLISAAELTVIEHLCRELAGNILKTDQPGKHPDYHELRPQKKARQITIGSQSERVGGQWPPNSMRRLIADLNLSSRSGGAKVGVIHEADRMNTATANAFLKTLEEPPRDTTLFLLTTQPYQLLPTIRSRCINVRIPDTASQVRSNEWASWLEQYRDWLESLRRGKLGRESASCKVVAVYGLVSRFEAIAAQLANEGLADMKASWPEHLTDEAREALEAGFRKARRSSLLREIQEATHAVAISDPEALTLKLSQATQALEQSAVMMDVFNMPQPAALENFLLKSLRIWAR